jgi:hypothetical protein
MADMLERVAKLLNQAENAGTEAEAATFMEAAQRVATTHSIDMAKARHATISKQRTVPVQRTIHIGERKQRGLRTLVDLCIGILEANDCECTIAGSATKVYAVGFAEDLDITEALFASLQVQQAKALAEFKAAGTWREEKVWVSSTSWPYGEWKQQTWLTARLNFQEAYAYRIGARLMDAKRAEERCQREADMDRQLAPHVDLASDGLAESFKQWFFDAHGLDLDEDDSTAQELSAGLRALRVGETDEDGWLGDFVSEYAEAVREQADNDSTALVLVEKRDAIAEAYAPMRARARGTYRGGTSGASSSSGRAAGRSAADRASLGRGTAIGGTRRALPA